MERAAAREGAGGSAAAQAGLMLCLSETIYPDHRRRYMSPARPSGHAGAGRSRPARGGPAGEEGGAISGDSRAQEGTQA